MGNDGRGLQMQPRAAGCCVGKWLSVQRTLGKFRVASYSFTPLKKVFSFVEFLEYVGKAGAENSFKKMPV